MALQWIHENPPHWDRTKARILGSAAPGVYGLGSPREGDLIPGEWWRVEEDGAVSGYGWMDCTWGDAEIMLAVDPAKRERGVGTFILDLLEREAAARGLNYLSNVVPPDHPDRARLTKWLKDRRFEESPEGLLKRRVRQSARDTS